jgi:hypothetical protein
MEPDENTTEPEDEVYGCISGEQTQILSREDEILVKLINKKAKDKAYRMGFPKRDVKPISEHGDTKNFVLPFHGCFQEGMAIYRIREKPKYCQWNGHTTFYTTRMVDLQPTNFGLFLR